MRAAGQVSSSPEAVIRAANVLAADLSTLPDADLAIRSRALRDSAADGRPVRAEGVALVSESYRRAAGLTLTGAQLTAGLVASDGGVAELADGEGKSAAAGLAAYLAALAGAPVHVAVLDERLARRDHDRIVPVLALLGVTVGLSTASLGYARRRAAYAADVTYASYLQFGQDYLQDGQAVEAADRVLRGLTFAVIDEVDTVLADQGRVLITTTGKPRPAEAGQYAALAELAGQLEPEVHYRLGSQPPVVTLTAAGEHALADAAGLTGPEDPERFALDRKLADAIAAVAWLTPDVDYTVRGRKLIPGERMQSFGRLARGVAQAVEAKEGLALTPEETLTGAITVRDFYRKYGQLAGLSATAGLVADELRHCYRLAVTPVPGSAARSGPT
jgi:preprotein translocase subunit SecA